MRVFTFPGSRQLGPHLLDAFQDHVAVAIEGLNAAEKLLVVPAVDQDLGVVLDRVGEDGQGAGVELFLLGLLQLLRGHLGLGLRRHLELKSFPKGPKVRKRLKRLKKTNRLFVDVYDRDAAAASVSVAGLGKIMF